MSLFSVAENISGSLAPLALHWLFASLQIIDVGKLKEHAHCPFDLRYKGEVHRAERIEHNCGSGLHFRVGLMAGYYLHINFMYQIDLFAPLGLLLKGLFLQRLFRLHSSYPNISLVPAWFSTTLLPKVTTPAWQRSIFIHQMLKYNVDKLTKRTCDM